MLSRPRGYQVIVVNKINRHKFLPIFNMETENAVKWKKAQAIIELVEPEEVREGFDPVLSQLEDQKQSHLLMIANSSRR